ncbi:MAG TPA: hypothetical protein VHS59_07460 [Bacillota bacterium]|nr:hypothetical protein [Bacillota bacterium]
MNTQYYRTWEEYLAEHPEITEQEAEAMKAKFQSYEDQMFAFLTFLTY